MIAGHFKILRLIPEGINISAITLLASIWLVLARSLQSDSNFLWVSAICKHRKIKFKVPFVIFDKQQKQKNTEMLIYERTW